MELSFENTHIPFPSFFYIDFKRPSKCIEGPFSPPKIEFVCRNAIFRYCKFWFLNSTRRILPESVFGKD